MRRAARAHDVYLNVAGGLEDRRAGRGPRGRRGSDLLLRRVAAAPRTPSISVRSSSPARSGPVGHMDQRLNEAAEAGLQPRRPARRPTRPTANSSGSHSAACPQLDELVAWFGLPRPERRGLAPRNRRREPLRGLGPFVLDAGNRDSTPPRLEGALAPCRFLARCHSHRHHARFGASWRWCAA